MPTRPVTWELDIPPASLLEPGKQAEPQGEVPSIDKLRTALMGTRFELLKISTFAAFLLAFVGVAIHGSHLANPDNQFVANTGAAMNGLANAVSSRTASLRGKTEALALAATQKAQAMVGHTTAAPEVIAQADVSASTHGKHAARVHHNAQATETAQIETAALEPRHTHRAHHRHAAVEMAAAEMPAAPVQWSGSLLDLPNFVSAEGSLAGHKILDVMQGGVEINSVAKVRSKGVRTINSPARHLKATRSVGVASDDSSRLAGLISPDSMVAAMASLLLYMIFVLVLIQMKGGLRSLGSSHAAV